VAITTLIVAIILHLEFRATSRLLVENIHL
jgi:hypothetical protein